MLQIFPVVCLLQCHLSCTDPPEKPPIPPPFEYLYNPLSGEDYDRHGDPNSPFRRYDSLANRSYFCADDGGFWLGK